jgi:outer membrane protein TolC
MKKLFFFSLLSLSVTATYAQTFLSKAEAIRVATDSSRKIEMAVNDIKTAEAQFKQTDAVFLPQLSLDYSGMITNNPMNAFGFKLQQRSISQNDFAPELLNYPKATGNFSTQAMLMQPIYNADILAMRQAARKQIAIADYKQQRTRDYIKFSAETEYNQLQLSHQMVAVTREALSTLQAIYKWTKDRYDQGYFQKSDLLNVDVNVKSIETQLAAANTAVQEHSDNVSLLMGRPIGNIYTVDSLQKEEDAANYYVLPQDRSDFKAMETAITAYDDMMKSTKRSLIPKINGFASYQLNDSRALGFSNGAYLAGAQMTWNIFKGNEVHNKLATQQSEQKQISLQLKDNREQDTKALAKANNQIKETSFQLVQYNAAVEQAKEALSILENRYKQGLVSTTDILQAQTQLSQQKLYYQQAVMMHNSTLAYIRFLTAH